MTDKEELKELLFLLERRRTHFIIKTLEMEESELKQSLYDFFDKEVRTLANCLRLQGDVLIKLSKWIEILLWGFVILILIIIIK